MFNWITGLFDRVFAVACAIICAQSPMFIQQYNQHLSGRVAELKYQVDSMAYAATLGHKSLDQYILRFIESGDIDFIRQGELMHRMTERYESFSIALNRLSEASLISKPFIFVRDFNWEIARSTFSEFQPGVPLTLEGFAYAILGIILGYGIFALISMVTKGCYHRLIHPFRRAKSQVNNGNG